MALLRSSRMNQASEAIVRWLEQKRRSDRASAAVISVLALGGGTAVFLVMTLVIYSLLSIFLGPFVHPAFWLWLAALGLTAGFFVHTVKSRRDPLDLGLDPMGFWILKDIGSVGPRLIMEGLRHVRCCALLAELNVTACAQALAFLAGQNAAVNWDDLNRLCPQVSWERLKEQLLLLDGVLFLGEDASRVTLMDPFRLRLRWMLEQEHTAGQAHEPARPRPEPPPRATPVNEPEKLSAYEILGLSPSASVAEIKTAYRRRMKACHPDLFAGMDLQARALAERWTKALNAAYATLNPRQGSTRPGSTRHG
jgi:DnaJ-domain-containing protein 1